MRSSSLAIEISKDDAPERPTVFEGEKLRYLKSYIRQPEFKVLLNNIVRTQAALGFKSLSVLSYETKKQESSAVDDKSFFICALALAYTCYLQSRVLIVETRKQPRERSLLFESILGEYPMSAQEGIAGKNTIMPGEAGFIDLLSTESFFEGERELADFQLGEHIRKCQEDYDLILVDTAAVNNHAEDSVHPLIVSRYMDRALLFVSEGESEEIQLEPVVRQIHASEVSLLGVVEGPATGERVGGEHPLLRRIIPSLQRVLSYVGIGAERLKEKRR